MFEVQVTDSVILMKGFRFKSASTFIESKLRCGFFFIIAATFFPF